MAYDTLGRPTSVKLPSGEVVTTTYDEEGVNTLAAGATSLIGKVGYNERGPLTLLQRPSPALNTTYVYHGASVNFRLNKILNGGEGSDALPDFIYGATGYDPVGNLRMMQMKLNSGTDTYSFYYDDLNRLTTTSLDGMDVASEFIYTYAYDPLGNITGRTGTDPDLTYSYGSSGTAPAVDGGPQAVTRVTRNVGQTVSYDYDARGNLDGRYEGTTLTHDYTFDVENRLASVRAANQTTAFAYDADGRRVMTTRPDGTIIYTPFPDYEMEDPPTGSNILRTTYRLGGQIIAVQHKVGAAAGTFYFSYTDHLGNITALSTTAGAYVTGSKARYDPFGTFTTTTPTSNPSISNHGFTGHRHNNTGTNDLDLIYMNARYYLPEVGRFISADTIVPEPGNPAHRA